MFDDFDTYEPYEDDLSAWEEEQVFQDTIRERDDFQTCLECGEEIPNDFENGDECDTCGAILERLEDPDTEDYDPYNGETPIGIEMGG